MIPDQYYRSPIVQAMLQRAFNANVGPAYSIGHGLALAGTQILNAVMAKQMAKDEQKQAQEQAQAMGNFLLAFTGSDGDSEDATNALSELNKKTEDSTADESVPQTSTTPVQPLNTGDATKLINQAALNANSFNPSAQTPTVDEKGNVAFLPTAANSSAAGGQLLNAAVNASSPQPSRFQPTPLADSLVQQRLNAMNGGVPVTPPNPASPPVVDLSRTPLSSNPLVTSVASDENLTPMDVANRVMPPVGIDVSPNANDFVARSSSPLVAAAGQPAGGTPTSMVETLFNQSGQPNRMAGILKLIGRIPNPEMKMQLYNVFGNEIFKQMFAPPRETYTPLTPEEFQNLTGQPLPPGAYAQRNTYTGKIELTNTNQRSLVNVNTGGNPNEDFYRETTAKTAGQEDQKIYVRYMEDLYKQAEQSAKTLEILNQFESLLALLPDGDLTGQLAPFEQNLNSYFRALGVKVDVNKLANREAIISLSNQLAIQQLQAFKGSTTDYEFNKVMQIVPSLSKTPQGNQLIILLQKKQLERAQKLQKLSYEYAQKTPRLEQTKMGLDKFIQDNFTPTTFSNEEKAQMLRIKLNNPNIQYIDTPNLKGFIDGKFEYNFEEEFFKKP